MLGVSLRTCLGFQSTPVLSYLGETTDNVDRTVYTFSGESLGAVANKREIIVGAVGHHSTTAQAIGGISIAGVAATIHQSITYDPGEAFSGAIASAQIASGTTGDIVVTFAGGMATCTIFVWRLVGHYSRIPFHAGADSQASGNATVSLNIPENGAALGCGINQNLTGAITWTGLATENYDAQDEANRVSAAMTASGMVAEAGRSIVFDGQADPNIMLASSWR